jgi:hypothetical protein
VGQLHFQRSLSHTAIDGQKFCAGQLRNSKVLGVVGFREVKSFCQLNRTPELVWT